MKQWFCVVMVAGALSGAVWKPVARDVPPLAGFWGLEENKGQAKAGVLFQARGALQGLVFDGLGIGYSPNGVRLNFVGGNLSPRVSLSDPLPGIVNAYSGGDESKWVRGVRRFTRAKLSGVYPGVDVSYVAAADESVTMRLEVGGGVEVGVLRWEIPQALQVSVSDGRLSAKIRSGKPGYSFYLPKPTGGRWIAYGTQQLGIAVDGRNGLAPSAIEVGLSGALDFPRVLDGSSDRGARGELYIAGTLPDVARAACTVLIDQPYTCRDAWVARYSAKGEMEWISYLEGEASENAVRVSVAPGGWIVLAGTTNSAGFPVAGNAAQRRNAGPIGDLYGTGDVFVSRLAASDGGLVGSTFLGGAANDDLRQVEFGGDGSVYASLIAGPGIPTSAGAFQASCAGTGCGGLLARIAPGLDRVLYATYLPGLSVFKVAADGSVYFAGSAGAGFPVSAAAYQKQPIGQEDGVIAKLDPTGTRLLFATYWGTPARDGIYAIALAAEGGVWVGVTSYDEHFAVIGDHLLRFDGSGSRVLNDLPIGARALYTDSQGRLITLTTRLARVSAGAFASGDCGYGYLILGAKGEELFSTQLPVVLNVGPVNEAGRPTFDTPNGSFEVDETLEGGVFGACAVEAGSYANPDLSSPGAIVTIWGTKMGPEPGVSYQLQGGRVPVQVGGTTLLVNGMPAPMLYVSANQVNAIVPFEVDRTAPAIFQLLRDGKPGNEWKVRLYPYGVSLFQRAALNEDGSLNTPKNPAKRGSIVVLYGTGGGATVPSSQSGEVTPLQLRRLEKPPYFFFGASQASIEPEFAGGAPGLVAGVTQFNVRVPFTARGTVPVRIYRAETGTTSVEFVTISVED